MSYRVEYELKKRLADLRKALETADFFQAEEIKAEIRLLEL